ncbi:MAG TPA: PIN domain-containing protein [Verrucomicrobiae bacterium]|jgi:predicted nucleic acid-binding protein|nr:PIN domain-containing protein [Verrucomicrobiae bacterium]
MGIVIDSSVLIAAERRRFDFQGFLFGHPGELFYIAAITVSELLHGCARASDSTIKARRLKFAENIFQDYAVIPFGTAEAREHSEIWVTLEISGIPIGERDLQIAATARANGYGIATLNRGEFERVSGLKLISLGAFIPKT